MARFDFRNYPDRLVIEAEARKLRVAEIDRFALAGAAWPGRQFTELSHAVSRITAGAVAHPRGQLPH